jgi:hypothetical protein
LALVNFRIKHKMFAFIRLYFTLSTMLKKSCFVLYLIHFPSFDHFDQRLLVFRIELGFRTFNCSLGRYLTYLSPLLWTCGVMSPMARAPTNPAFSFMLKLNLKLVGEPFWAVLGIMPFSNPSLGLGSSRCEASFRLEGFRGMIP